MRVVVVGGYGNFGTYVARSLAGDRAITLIIAGRDLGKAQAAARDLGNGVEAGLYDISGPAEALAKLRPDLVINMVGPYNEQGYAVAEAAIACGAHYCDIADAREFVAAIGQLDEQARAAGVAALAGASSVPALTAAYLDAAAEVMTIRSVTYGISGAEQANRGAGTVAAVLAYVGQRFTTLREGRMEAVTGWSDTHAVEYPELGRRWFGRGNVPDLALFLGRYPTLQTQEFWAGHEIALLHFGTAVLGKLASVGVLPRLDRFAGLLSRLSKPFNRFGRSRSGFHMVIEGEGVDGSPVIRRHFIIARQGHGPYLPCIPVILIARKLSRGEAPESGARPAFGTFTLAEFREACAELDVSFIDP